MYRTDGTAARPPVTPRPIPLPPAPARAHPAHAPAAPASGGWLEGAMAMMALPLIMTAGIMLAPLALIWAARKSQNG